MLGPFPAVPAYSEQFNKCLTREDKEKMVKREYDLLEWAKQAKILEKEYNK